ncbi:TIGR01244 family sulfur transferase [Pseudooceanicola nanhaiensis]|uniref:TIGR01244 family sulfur transferase n=1 Tax=Pseudooceanicola nanhaiensis TaxID=375761 RepID=UPI001CD78075|nr:TIGR01244 family sulfur transferase [Pseudooceanicola nanhaiensis]MCA0919358.1 TIGR01244 family phosphatase [Pseudooceanicola nanhaiensis]
MEPRHITPRYSVSPQILPEDLPAIKAAGFTRVICNRPDEENPPELRAAAMAEAAQAAGLDFVVLPLTHQTMTPENIAKQEALVAEAEGPVLAYCASGTRCSVIWSLGQAAQGVPADDILMATAKAGYDLSQLRPRLEQG